MPHKINRRKFINSIGTTLALSFVTLISKRAKAGVIPFAFWKKRNSVPPPSISTRQNILMGSFTGKMKMYGDQIVISYIGYLDTDGDSYARAAIGTAYTSSVSVGGSTIVRAYNYGGAATAIAINHATNMAYFGYTNGTNLGENRTVTGAISGNSWTKSGTETSICYAFGGFDYTWDPTVSRILYFHNGAVTYPGDQPTCRVKIGSAVDGSGTLYNLNMSNYCSEYTACYTSGGKSVLCVTQGGGGAGLVAYGYSYVVTSTNATTLSTGTADTFSSNNPSENCVCYVGNDKIVVFYSSRTWSYDGTNYTYIQNGIKAKVGTISGSSISWGPECSINNVQSNYLSVCYVENMGKVFFSFGLQSDYKAYYVLGIISGSTISFASPVCYESSGSSQYMAAQYNTVIKNVVVVYSQSPYIYARVIQP